MTIIEYTPRTFGARMQHRREIRRMTDGVMPRNTTPALLAVFVAVTILFTLALCAWWSAGAAAEEYTFAAVTGAPNGLWVRQGPGVEYPTQYLLANGARLVLHDTQSGFALVAWPNRPTATIGWVSVDYLEVVR